MKPVWHWDVDACITELGNLLANLPTREIAKELAKEYANSPTSSAIVGQLNRSVMPASLERIFGKPKADAILRAYRSRACEHYRKTVQSAPPQKPTAVLAEKIPPPSVTSETPKTSPEVPLASKTTSEPTASRVVVPFSPKLRALSDDLDAEEYLNRYFENEAARATRIGRCRGKNDSCTNTPKGGPYCVECGVKGNLYQPAKSDIGSLEREIRWRQRR